MKQTKPIEWQLSGKVVLVTGAARGIGAAIASALAAQGCTVFAADVDEKGVKALAGQSKGSVAAMRLDVCDRAGVASAIASVRGAHGGLDVLVNNAGLLTRGSFDATTGEDWDRLVGVNVTGIFNCVQAAVPAMRGREGASIINIASVSAYKGGGAMGNVWYGATKAAVVAITMGLGRELGPEGIRVNAIAPAVIATDMVRAHLDPETQGRVTARIPLGRLATEADIANATLFLASQAASFVTGETLTVDGGFLRT